METSIKIFAMILNVISRDKHIEDNKRGFKSILSSRNLENDIEDEKNSLTTKPSNSILIQETSR